jgi:DNA-directed RNA polymerase specialized sigma24 family protein
MTRRFGDERCTSNDYRRLFAGSAERLQWLCYLLTGNEEMSEKLLSAALEQSLKGSDHVFREWMVSWARRLIIRVCIDAVRPQIAGMTKACYLVPPIRLDAIDPDRLAEVLSLPTEEFQERLLELDVLSRFVFVLRALEGYSRRDTSLMLDIDDRTCEWVYVRTAEALEESVAVAKSMVVPNNFSEAGWALAQAGD